MTKQEKEDALYDNYKCIESTYFGTITKRNGAYFQRVGWGLEAYLKPKALNKKEAISIMKKELYDYYEHIRDLESRTIRINLLELTDEEYEEISNIFLK